MKITRLYATLIQYRLLTMGINAHAEVVGATVIGVTVGEVAEIAVGWSVKKTL